MLFPALIFGFMVAVQVFMARDLEPSTQIRFWLVFTLSGFLIAYVFKHPIGASLVQGPIMVAYFLKAYTVSSRAGGV